MTDTTTTTASPRTRWGRSARLGGGQTRLVTASLLCGAVASVLFGLVAFLTFGEADPARPWLPWLTVTAVAVVNLPVTAALFWALFVDRSTVQGAVRNPEDSVESRWYDAAAVGAFHDLLIVIGLGTAATAFTRWQADLTAVGCGLILFTWGDMAVRYLMQKRRG
ncbi:hypothetical protein [Micrococcus cohnii]|uniref:Uncharacterized protein n=1 Tax=Micrococcus cohnii TaxID=993416 RepID=A0A7W7GQI6_9MICC|nr:hypothetical protein [Micrococcus cohnii]MBB4736439.1 hypothetical protein [Micrococcus cohnii]